MFCGMSAVTLQSRELGQTGSSALSARDQFIVDWATLYYNGQNIIVFAWNNPFSQTPNIDNKSNTEMNV